MLINPRGGSTWSLSVNPASYGEHFATNVDENALVVALREGRLWGVGLDVFEQEPPPHDSPLRQFDNVTFTPHVAASSEDSVVELYRTGAQIAVDIFHGRWPESVVNPSVAAVTARVTELPQDLIR